MKVKKVSVSIPGDLLKHVDEKARDLTKKRGSRVTTSSFLAELIAKDKAKEVGELAPA